MESLKLLASILLLIAVAHASDLTCTCPLDCIVGEWIPWSRPIFGDSAIRTRSVLQNQAHNGTKCPHLMEEKHTGTTVTTKQVAKSLASNFLYPQAVNRSRTTREAENPRFRDLLVILDSSGSVGAANFQLAIEQIAKLLGSLCPKKPKPFSKDQHKLAVIRYSSSATEMFDFNAHPGHFKALKSVGGIKFTGGGTNTAAAFDLARNMFVKAKGARLDDDNVKQEILILTDGKSNDPAKAIAAAQSLHKNVDVFGLVIGKFTDAGRDEILQYVSQPTQTHLFWLENFDNLEDLVKKTVKGKKKCSKISSN